MVRITESTKETECSSCGASSCHGRATGSIWFGNSQYDKAMEDAHEGETSGRTVRECQNENDSTENETFRMCPVERSILDHKVVATTATTTSTKSINTRIEATIISNMAIILRGAICVLLAIAATYVGWQRCAEQPLYQVSTNTTNAIGNSSSSSSAAWGFVSWMWEAENNDKKRALPSNMLRVSDSATPSSRLQPSQHITPNVRRRNRASVVWDRIRRESSQDGYEEHEAFEGEIEFHDDHDGNRPGKGNPDCDGDRDDYNGSTFNYSNSNNSVAGGYNSQQYPCMEATSNQTFAGGYPPGNFQESNPPRSSPNKQDVNESNATAIPGRYSNYLYVAYFVGLRPQQRSVGRTVTKVTTKYLNTTTSYNNENIYLYLPPKHSNPNDGRARQRENEEGFVDEPFFDSMDDDFVLDMFDSPPSVNRMERRSENPPSQPIDRPGNRQPWNREPFKKHAKPSMMPSHAPSSLKPSSSPSLNSKEDEDDHHITAQNSTQFMPRPPHVYYGPYHGKNQDEYNAYGSYPDNGGGGSYNQNGSDGGGDNQNGGDGDNQNGSGGGGGDYNSSSVDGGDGQDSSGGNGGEEDEDNGSGNFGDYQNSSSNGDGGSNQNSSSGGGGDGNKNGGDGGSYHGHGGEHNSYLVQPLEELSLPTFEYEGKERGLALKWARTDPVLADKTDQRWWWYYVVTYRTFWKDTMEPVLNNTVLDVVEKHLQTILELSPRQLQGGFEQDTGDHFIKIAFQLTHENMFEGDDDYGTYAPVDNRGRTFDEAIDPRHWDALRFLGLAMFLGTILPTFILGQLAKCRRRRKRDRAKWGNLATERGLDELLRTGWQIKGENIVVYDRKNIGLYREDDSMLMGSNFFEERRQIAGTSSSCCAGPEITVTHPSSETESPPEEVTASRFLSDTASNTTISTKMEYFNVPQRRVTLD